VSSLKQDLAVVVNMEAEFYNPGWAHALAIELQMMEEARVDGFAWSDGKRQAYRRAMRWAKQTPTADVEKALKEAVL
jgi:hypothetical protein